MKRFTTGTAVPFSIALCLVADVLFRFAPVGPLAFRGWEVATRYRAPDAPFGANVSFHTDRAYGDLAGLGNRPETRQYRSETFTTDPWGYRNLSPASRNPGALLVGDSFSAGASVSDDSTLSVQVERLIGCPVYNAAGQIPDPARIQRIAGRLGMSRGVVLYEFLERSEPPGAEAKGDAQDADVERRMDGWGLGPAYRLFLGWTRVSPVEVVASRAYRSLEDDRWLPRAAPAVIERRLRSGDEMLFLTAETTMIRQHRSRGEFVPYWRMLRWRLQDEGLGLLVILVPNKYTVYGDLLAPPDDRVAAGISLLERVERGLRDSGIAVANLGPPLRRAAAAGVADARYVYWRDDTHWNADGIAVAAAEVARVWPQAAGGASNP